MTWYPAHSLPFSVVTLLSRYTSRSYRLKCLLSTPLPIHALGIHALLCRPSTGYLGHPCATSVPATSYPSLSVVRPSTFCLSLFCSYTFCHLWSAHPCSAPRLPLCPCSAYPCSAYLCSPSYSPSSPLLRVLPGSTLCLPRYLIKLTRSIPIDPAKLIPPLRHAHR